MLGCHWAEMQDQLAEGWELLYKVVLGESSLKRSAEKMHLLYLDTLHAELTNSIRQHAAGRAL
jgi:hypothetical protein